MRSRPFQLFLGALMMVALTLHLFAPPAWWSTRSVLSADSADDYAVLNQGQLKNFMRGAIEEMNASLPGGAGTELNALLASWRTNSSGADDFAIANQGQLKAMGNKIRTRMLELGMPSTSVGTTAPGDDEDFLPANLGQAKLVFKIAFNGDSDLDGIPDNWEMATFGHLSRNMSLDADMDGFSDSAEYAAGTDPLRWLSNPSNNETWLALYTPVVK
jgi:hypothetical protein